VKPIKILIKCVIKITQSFKTVYDFFITVLNEMIKINQA